MSSEKKEILFISKTYPGKEHDKTIFLNERFYKFLPDRIKKYFDTAFEGLEKDCPDKVFWIACSIWNFHLHQLKT